METGVQTKKEGTDFVTPSTASDPGPDSIPNGGARTGEDAILEHILDCDLCLDVICDPRVSTQLCESRCPEYRRLIAAAAKR